MKKYVITLFVLLALFGASFAGATSSDQGRRLAGPFCVGKAWVKPLHVGGNKISRAGVVRSVALTEKCQVTEIRKVGLAVPDPDEASPGTPKGTPAPGPGTAGPAGPKGDKGDTGSQGVAGKDGKNGKDGLGDGFVYACVSNGGSVQLNVNGQPCGDNQGHTQIKLVVVQ
jgi:hypothetical protein